MAAAYVLNLKTAAVVGICVVAMLLVQTTAELGYPTPTAPVPARGGLACPDAQNACRTTCRPGCEGIAPAMCQAVCAASPVAGLACVDMVFSACQTFCKTACESLSSP